ncbi:MAG: hypothetical protein F2609_00550, partial [Actinobacteria bacterium]|nr:hypothetical protein [Actinomycetota bacterium]
MLVRIASFLSVVAVLFTGLIFAPAVESKVSFDSASGSYSVKPADLSLVCPGAVFRTGGDSGTKLSQVNRTGKATASITAFGAGSIEISSVAESNVSELELDSERIFVSRELDDATSLTNLNAQEDPVQGALSLTASTSQLVATDSMRGLAAASCQLPSNDFYIVGGSTAAGREALLVLTNPSPIDATADLGIFTDLGAATVAGLAGISVPAGSTTVLSLASFAPTVPALAVQVQSQGAKLAGWIQQRAVRGTAAQGVDWISPNPAATLQAVIPGLVIRGTKVINQVAKSEENSDAGHAVRVFAPEGANVTVQIIASEEDVFGAVFTGIVEPGSVQDFPISELLDGNYSVFVTSDKPIYAGVRVARGNSGGTPRLDFAWLSPADELVSDRAITVPADGET